MTSRIGFGVLIEIECTARYLEDLRPLHRSVLREVSRIRLNGFTAIVILAASG